MARFKRSSKFAIVAIAFLITLTLAVGVNFPTAVQAQLQSGQLSNKLPSKWEFQAPRSEDSIPDNRQGGATRGGCTNDDSFAALVPASGGTTTAEYPTIYWYMPKTTAFALEFVLKDAKKQTIYSTKYALAKSDKGIVTNTPNIMSLTIPAFTNLSPLQINQEYQWSLALICNLLDSSGKTVVEGKIKRVETNPTLAARLNKAAPQERVALYAESRIWYDAFSTLMELKNNNPNNLELVDAMNKLIASVGLDTVTQKPVNSSFTPEIRIQNYE